jgi:hypothetical protein
MAEKKVVRKAAKAAPKKAAPKKAAPKKAAPKKAAPKKAAPGKAIPAKAAGQAPASELITARIRELGDWRGETLAQVRKLIHEADPAIVEEWKWMGTPVWSRDGIICTGETYKQVVKLTFAKGAFLADPKHLFNAGLTGNVRRAIDIRQEDKVDGPALRALIRAAIAYNQGHPPKHRGSSGKSSPDR